MSYQGKKSIPHITVSGPGRSERCPRSFVRGAGKGVRRQRRGRAVPGAGGQSSGCGAGAPRGGGVRAPPPVLLPLELWVRTDFM